MVVRTHTFTVYEYADPYLKCTECGDKVTGFRSDNQHNYPCNHIGMESCCVSWSPVDGCTCKDSHG